MVGVQSCVACPDGSTSPPGSISVNNCEAGGTWNSHILHNSHNLFYSRTLQFILSDHAKHSINQSPKVSAQSKGISTIQIKLVIDVFLMRPLINLFFKQT